jgi:RNA polymerase sigma-70 factor (ECF subfamily)
VKKSDWGDGAASLGHPARFRREGEAGVHFTNGRMSKFPDSNIHTPSDLARTSDMDGADRVAVVALAEARLEARAADGDREAIDSVWRRNRRWLASVLAAHAPRGVEVEDLLQEVAATFVAKARDIRDAASVRGWLRVVAVNTARMSARRRAAERRSLEQLSVGLKSRESGGRADQDARETLALLSQLPAQYAEPLLLQAGQGLSQREIADILELPETTIETRLARARRMLRTLAAESALDASTAKMKETSTKERMCFTMIGLEQARTTR